MNDVLPRRHERDLAPQLGELGPEPHVAVLSDRSSEPAKPAPASSKGALDARRFHLVSERAGDRDGAAASAVTARIVYRLAGILTAPLAVDKASYSALAAAADVAGFGRAWTAYLRTLIGTWPDVAFQLVITKPRGLGQHLDVWLVAAITAPDAHRARAQAANVHEGLASAHLLLARHVEWAPVVDDGPSPLDLPVADLVELAPRELPGDAYAFAPWYGPGADVERLAEALVVWPCQLAIVVTLGAATLTATEATLLHRNGAELTAPAAGDSRAEVHVYLAADGRLSDALVHSVGELLLDAPGVSLHAAGTLRRDGFTPSRTAEATSFDDAITDLRRGRSPHLARTAAPEPLRRARFLLPPGVAARLFCPPVAPVAQLLNAGRAPGAPLSLPRITGACFGEVRFCGNARRASYTDRDASQHTYTIGRTGTGKTTLLHNLALDWVRHGHGVAIIDPHGDLASDFLASVPDERAGDVIVFDPTDVDFPIGLNLLEYDAAHPAQRSLYIDELFRIFDTLFNMHLVSGPIFEQYFRYSLLLLMDDTDRSSDITLLARVFSDKAFRRDLVRRCASPIVRRFWADAENTSGDVALHNMAFYITSKLDSLISNAYLLPILGQERSRLDLRAVLDSRSILVVRLNKGGLGGRATRLLGMVFVMRILFAAMSRSELDPAARLPFHLIVDEVQNMLTPTLAELLSEARKYGLRVTLANQNLAQMPDDLRAAILGNVGSLVGFRVGAADAELLAAAMGQPALAPALVSLQNHQAIVRALIGGEIRPPFTVHTPPVPPQRSERVAALVAQSRQRYARGREEVLADIYRRQGDD